MKRLFMAAIVIVAAAGCGKDGGGLAGKAKSLADQACACKKGDAACLDKAEAAWEAWESEARKGKRPDEATMAKIEAEEDRAEKCAEAAAATE